MLAWTLGCRPRLGLAQLAAVVLSALAALALATPVAAAADTVFDCRFTEFCLGDTCEALDGAPMRLLPIGLDDGSAVAVFVLADSRLLQGLQLEENEDVSLLFGAYEAGSHPTVQSIGTWINANDDPRREVVITFGEATRLMITSEATSNALLTKAGRGLAALFGSSRATGTCQVVDLSQQ